jgi:lycopene cyclase domain-containing protein
LNPKFYYLFVDLGCIFAPFLLSFHPKSQFYKTFKALSYGLLAMMLVFIPMDALFTYWNIWHFNPNYISGAYLGNLPLEEILFFICIPFACVFTFDILRKYHTDRESRVAELIAIVLIAINFITLYNHPHLSYTLYANISSAVILVYFLLKQAKYLTNFLISWGILALPFLLSNGILTGIDFYTHPIINTNYLPTDYIVGYNNAENLAIRIWTIPVEDFFYGLGMFGLTTVIYLSQLRRANSTTTAR